MEHKKNNFFQPVTPTRDLPKNVSFSNLIQVVLIPCNQEYKDAKLSSVLWSNPSELARYKNEAHDEIKQLMEAEKISCKEAIHRLFRSTTPSDDEKELESPLSLPSVSPTSP